MVTEKHKSITKFTNLTKSLDKREFKMFYKRQFYNVRFYLIFMYILLLSFMCAVEEK